MSYFEDKIKPAKVRLRLDPKDPFPEKLYDVANVGYLVRWNGCGTAVEVDDPELFEEVVMTCYPGFLQIPSFLNFRRLFREYSFSWRLLDDGVTLEFSHPGFVYGHREAISEIRTKRKSFSKPSYNHSSFHRDVMALNNDDDGDENGPRRYRTRRSRLTKRRSLENSPPNSSKDYSNSSNFVINDTFEEGENSNDPFKANTGEISNVTHTIESQLQSHTNNRSLSDVSSEILRLFIKNEFTFEDFCAWAERNQTDYTMNVDKWDVIETMSSQTDMSSNSYAESSVSETSEYKTYFPENTSLVEPCGYCRCCKAYQHYNQMSGCYSDSSYINIDANLSAPGELELSCDDDNQL